MSTERLIASHLRLSDEALRAADVLSQIGNRNSVYQAEQAVEQMILALAQSERVHIPRSIQHQLDRMVDALPAENSFRVDLRSLTWLEAYGHSRRPFATKVIRSNQRCDEAFERRRRLFPSRSNTQSNEAGSSRSTPSMIAENAVNFAIPLGMDRDTDCAWLKEPTDTQLI